MEAAGLSSVTLALVRGQIERSAPPRAMYVEFPLGRPLGKPLDPEYQRRVITSALDLLSAESGPVLVDHPDVISDESSEQLACALPPSFDPDLPPAVDEAQALRAAYNRTVERLGKTSVGRVVDADNISDAVELFIRLASGVPLEDADPPGGDHLAAAMDLRSYYEEAALSLSDHVPGARQAESWIYQSTQLGEVLHAAQEAVKGAGAERKDWYYIMPSTQARST